MDLKAVIPSACGNNDCNYMPPLYWSTDTLFTCETVHRRGERCVASFKTGYCIQEISDKLHEGTRSTSVYYFYCLKKCANVRALSEGKRLHAHIIKGPPDPSINAWNTLINMYIKCGSLVDAALLFTTISGKDVYTWTSLIGGYSKHGYDQEAFVLFQQMQEIRLEPDIVTFICILSICGNLLLLELGKWVHAYVIKSSYGFDIHLQNTLMNMYMKCGCSADAYLIFGSSVILDDVSWNVIIGGYALGGGFKEAMSIFKQMQQGGMRPDKVGIIGLLNFCARSNYLGHGKWGHALVIKFSLQSNVMLGNTIIDMYGKCGSIMDAEDVFNRLFIRDLVSWNALVAGYARNGHVQESFKIVRHMYNSGLVLDEFTFISFLPPITHKEALGHGKLVHAYGLIIKLGHILENAFIHMYSKCGDIVEASEIFFRMRTLDVVSWNELIFGHMQQQNFGETFGLLRNMQHEGLVPNKITFINILKFCALEQGKLIHSYILRKKGPDTHIGNSLLRFYICCGCRTSTYQVFESMLAHDVVSWNTVIAENIENGSADKVVRLYEDMEKERVRPDKLTFIYILQAYATLGLLYQGRQLHEIIKVAGCETDNFVGSALVDMYSKLGCPQFARQVFDKLSTGDVVPWTAMISGYVHNGNEEAALKLFMKMQKRNVKPDTVTFVTVLTACSRLTALAQGRIVHAKVIKGGHDLDNLLGSSLMNMYVKTGFVEDAHKIFMRLDSPDAFAWTVIFGACAEYDRDISSFYIQVSKEGRKLDRVTCMNMVCACTSLGSLNIGKWVHAYILTITSKSGLDTIVSNALIDMYGKSGRLTDAYEVFYKMPLHDTVSWNIIIAGYIHNSYERHALDLFHEIQDNDIKMDKFTFINILNACANLGLLGRGKELHAWIIRSQWRSDISVENTLINMYARCGSIKHVYGIFDRMKEWDLVSWNAMIEGYAQHGNGKNILQVLKNMQAEGMLPNETTCVSVLSSCRHAGFLDNGFHYLSLISQFFRVLLKEQHFACLIDHLARMGKLDEAHDFISSMPLQPSHTVWNALIDACKNHAAVSLETL